MNYAYCTNNHWYWFFPVGFFIFITLFFIVSRFLWWGGRYKHFGRWQDYEHSNSDPMHIVKARYAAGKITKEAYDKIKKDLGE
jgi:uncharacterized membrane protein